MSQCCQAATGHQSRWPAFVGFSNVDFHFLRNEEKELNKSETAQQLVCVQSYSEKRCRCHIRSGRRAVSRDRGQPFLLKRGSVVLARTSLVGSTRIFESFDNPSMPNSIGKTATTTSRTTI